MMNVYGHTNYSNMISCDFPSSSQKQYRSLLSGSLDSKLIFNRLLIIKLIATNKKLLELFIDVKWTGLEPQQGQ